MQYNTVVSGAMKLLNALEDFKGASEPGADAAVREGFGILLRVLYPVDAAYRAGTLGGAGLCQAARRPAGCALAAQVDEQALDAGRDRAGAADQRQAPRLGARCRPAASLHEIEKLAIASEDFVKHAGGAMPRKVIVVAGRLVNVVI